MDYSKDELQLLFKESENYIFPERFDVFKSSINSMVLAEKELGMAAAKDIVETLKLLNSGKIENAKQFWNARAKSYKGEAHNISPIVILSTKVIYNTSKFGELFYKALYLEDANNVNSEKVNQYKKLVLLNSKFRSGKATKEDCNSRYL